MTSKTILVVEDERMIAEDILESLSELGYHVPVTAATGAEALEKARQYKPDLILMDIMLKGDWDGIQTAQEIHKEHDCALIYLTAFTDQEVLQRAKITTPFGYILKPFREKELHAMVEVSLYRHESERNNRERQQMILNTLSQSKEAILVTDQDGLLIFMNHEAEHLLGHSSQALMKKSLQSLLTIKSTEKSAPLELLLPSANQSVFIEINDQAAIPARLTVNRLNQGAYKGFILAILPLPMHTLEAEEISNLIPVCASCKNIRSSQGHYVAMEQYFREQYDYHFSHGICPTCFENLYPDYFSEATDSP